MDTKKTVQPVAVGDHVIVVDTHGRRNHALVTAVWGVFGTKADWVRKCMADQPDRYEGKSFEEVAETYFPKATGHDWEQEMQIPSLNTVLVDPDPSKTDSYGRQINRNFTSVVHESNQSAHGNYWMNA